MSTQIDIELNRRTETTSDLAPEAFDDVLAECYTWERKFGFQSGHGFRNALIYLAGLSQKKVFEDEGIRFIQKWRGRREFSDFMRALLAIQIKIDKIRTAQDAEHRRAQCSIAIRDVSAIDDTSDLQSRDPNFTKSFQRSRDRLRLVK